MAELLIREEEIHDRLGLRTLKPVLVGHGPKVNLRRLNMSGTMFLRRADVVQLLRSESETLGGDPVLDRLADLIMEVTT